MRNLQFGYGHLVDGAVASAITTASGYLAQNVVTLSRDTGWKGSGGTAAERLRIHCASSISPTMLAIAGGNYSQWGTTKLQHSTDGSTWADYVTLGSLPSVDGDQDYRKEIAAIAKPWWALYWAAPLAPPEVRAFDLCNFLTASKNDSYGGAVEDVDGTDLQRTEGGVLNSEETHRMIQRFDLKWNRIDATLKEQIRTIYQTQRGRSRPFWFVPIDESGSSTEGRAYMVRFEPSALRAQRNFITNYELAYTLLEEV